MREFQINVITRRPLSEIDWLKLLRIQCQRAEFVPTRYDLYEPLRRHFDVRKSEEAVKTIWTEASGRGAFGWRNDRLEGRLAIKFPPMPRFSQLASWGEYPAMPPQPAMVDVFQQSSVYADALFGFIHLLNNAELKTLDQSASRVVACLTGKNATEPRYGFALSPMLLSRYLPELFWANIFGTPYIRMFGKERLLSAPAYRVSELENGLCYVQLTEHITDMLNDLGKVEQIRREVKAHLGLDAFYYSQTGSSHRYVTPEDL